MPLGRDRGLEVERETLDLRFLLLLGGLVASTGSLVLDPVGYRFIRKRRGGEKGTE
jgi:hypothetical protein